jgi:hypothetical protein
MSTLGSTSKPTASQMWSGPNLNEQVAEAHTFPAGGPWRVTKIGIWVAGKTNAANFRGVVWSADRNTILGQTATFAATGRSFGIGNCDNYERNVSAQFVVAGGTTVYIGWWRQQDDVGQFGRTSDGSYYYDTETGGAPAPMSGEALNNTDGIGAYLYYELDNTAPGAPTNVKIDSLASGSIANGADTSWTLSFSGNDPGDVMASYDYQIDTTSGNGVVPDWASLVADVTGRTNGISGQSVSSVITHTLSRGQWYALRVRTKDDGGLTGSWSAVYYFKVNSLPTVGTRTPGASAFAVIHNIASDLQAWTAAGAFAKPRLAAIYNDADGQQSGAYRFRIYNAASGTEGDASMVHDSGEVAYVAAAGSTVTYDANFAIVAGTERWWTVKFRDSLGEWCAESSRTAFKMRFGQAIYEYDPGASSSGWQWSNGAIANGYGAFLFATASGSGGAGRSAFVADIGGLNSQVHSPGDTWLNVLVRLAPNAAGTNVTLPNMTFTYIGGATTPDRWQVAGGASILLDLSVRRYGSQSLKVTTAASTSYVYPFTYPAGAQADIPVVGGVRYTWSLYVKTGGVLTTGIRLAVYQAGTATYLLDGVTGQNVVGALVTDTSGDEEGWRRLTLTLTVPAGVSFVRPVIEYAGATAGQVFWIDATDYEEGGVASHWRPGLIGNAFVADTNGLMIDGYAGGIMRLRGTGGGSRDLVELGTNGLLFGADTPVYSPAASVLRVDSALRLNSDSQIRRSAAKVLTFEDDAGAVLTGVDLLQAELRRFLISKASVNAAVSTEGSATWDDSIRALIMGDSVRAKPVTPVGFLPFALPEGYVPQDTPTGATLAASGGSICVPFRLVAPMLAETYVFRNLDTSGAHTLEARLYVDRRNNSGTADSVPVSGATWTFTPSAASDQASTSLSGLLLAPGLYWLVIRNSSASVAAAVGRGSATAMLTTLSGSAFYKAKAGLGALGATLDLVTGWSGVGRVPAVAIGGRVLGQSGAW